MLSVFAASFRKLFTSFNTIISFASYSNKVYLKSLIQKRKQIKKRNTSFCFGNEILRYAQVCMERVMGIEPTTTAWKAVVLPLNYTRIFNFLQVFVSTILIYNKFRHISSFFSKTV